MSISHEQFSKIQPQGDNELFTKKDLRQLSKQISQLIAKSWLPGGEQIRATFLSNDLEKIKEMFLDNQIDIKMLGVGEYTTIELDWSSFFGKLEESKDPKYTFKFVIAYPPRPSEYNLSDAQLNEWVKNNDENNYTPIHPYIPVTW